MRQIARRLLPVIEGQLGLTVYPDQKTCWHYDDKIAQAYLLRAAGIPTPRSWVWFDREQAVAWARQAGYPLVLKLASGAGSRNIRLVNSVDEAIGWIELLFVAGVPCLDRQWHLPPGWDRLSSGTRLLLKGDPPDPPWELNKDYVLFQEFLPGNDFDTRVTIIGDRAFGFRRFNRPGDFRASGSGDIDWDPEKVSSDFIHLAFKVASLLGLQSCAVDGLRRHGEAVVGEISYAFASWAVEACPGHWDSKLDWHPGRMWPEEAQVADFLSRLNRHGATEGGSGN
jgi:glutathione synthase/RimK-type ligase-like ATP-grasp enzyme